jgi:hypothetical protein
MTEEKITKCYRKIGAIANISKFQSKMSEHIPICCRRINEEKKSELKNVAESYHIELVENLTDFTLEEHLEETS